MWLDEKHREHEQGQCAVSRSESAGILPASRLLIIQFGGRIPALRAIQRRNIWLLSVLLSLFVTGCATVSLPPVNLKQPGWNVRRGQAIWRRERGGEGIAGDILVATRSDGRAFVQFSKTPFPLVVGQIAPRGWEVEFPPRNKHYSGHGQPPGRIIFLQLPRVLSGRPPPRNWTWQRLSSGGWRLENRTSGESLDVYFNP